MKKNHINYDFTKEEIEAIRQMRKPAADARAINEYEIRKQKRMIEIEERQRKHEEIDMFRYEMFNTFGPAIVKLVMIVIGFAITFGSAALLDNWFDSWVYELAYTVIASVVVIPACYAVALRITDKLDKIVEEKFYW